MALNLRICIIVVSILFLFFVLRRIRKAQMQISDSFWIIASIVFVIIGIFPQIVIWLSKITGVQSPANLVFLMIIFVLLLRIFNLSCKLSSTENALHSLAEQYAVDHKLTKKKDE